MIHAFAIVKIDSLKLIHITYLSQIDESYILEFVGTMKPLILLLPEKKIKHSITKPYKITYSHVDGDVLILFSDLGDSDSQLEENLLRKIDRWVAVSEKISSRVKRKYL